MTDIISANNITYAYGSDIVLKNITLHVKKGDFLAILGPNGSGKTTLMKIILGMVKPEQGNVQIFDTAVDEYKHWHNVGYVPQRYSIDKNFPATVRELLAIKAPKNTTRHLIDESMLDKKFASLSGGQQQRVLIELSLSTNPKLLILDEPDAGIDNKSQHEFYQILQKLNAKGLTILLVSHDIGFVSKTVKRVFCMNKTIAYEGSVQDIHKLVDKTYKQSFEVHKHA